MIRTVALVLLVVSACHPVPRALPSRGPGAVATDSSLATAVGVSVLRKGGNAIDAAVATAFALAVVFPQAGNLGGGGFAVLHMYDGTEAALDFRETAPAAATRDMFTQSDQSLTGSLAAGVPGTVAGLWALHRRYGKTPWKDLVTPAIHLAEEGFAVDPDFARTVGREAERLARFPASAALFLPAGQPVPEGARWRNPDLARTLRSVADQGMAGFYEGEIADLIAQEMQRGKGIVTREDLRAYRPVWREPVSFVYRGHRVLSMPPPSSGGLVLALLAHILEAFELTPTGRESPETIHLLAEAMRRAFALRNHHLGDPDFVQIPTDLFLSQASAESLRATIDRDRATPSARITEELAVGAKGGDGAHTTHFSIVDAHGSAVALTTTINTLYGSAVTVTGAGFLLNNEMDDFATRPGQPNAFGLVQGERNAIEPGKRMLSSMTPTIVLGEDSEVRLVTGAAGGPTIITTVFQVISNVLDHEMRGVEAVLTPRFHHQHLPDRILHEGLAPEAQARLGALGHQLTLAPQPIADAPSVFWEDGRYVGTPEPRQEGSAAETQ